MSEYCIPVRKLNEYVKARLRNDPFLADIWIEGEVSELNVRNSTAYLRLSDGSASVDGIVFQFTTSPLREILVPGQNVLVRGDVSVYVPLGRFSIQIREAKPAGLGALLLQMMALQKKLEAAGLFAEARKRELPPYPREIAVITSKDGAALQDIKKIAARRNRSVRLRVYPVTVQGSNAAQTIAHAFDKVNADGTADLVIVARGGGSAADLSAFNDERVVRAVVSSRVPVVSAVGHETDWTFCDLAADKRVPTPSAAAEQAIPEASIIQGQIRQIMQLAQKSVHAALERAALRLQTEVAGLRSTGMDVRLRAGRDEIAFLCDQEASHLTAKLRDSRAKVHEQRQQILRSADMQLRLQAARSSISYAEEQSHALSRAALLRLRAALSTEEQKLRALDPLRILSAGYAVVLRDGLRIYEADELHTGDVVQLMFKDGTVEAEIQ